MLDGARGAKPWHYIAGPTVLERVGGADAGVEFVPAVLGGLAFQRLPVKPRRSYASQTRPAKVGTLENMEENPNEPGHRNA